MVASVHVTDCIIYLLYINGHAKNVAFVVKQYAAVRRVNMKQYAVRKGVGFTLILGI